MKHQNMNQNDQNWKGELDQMPRKKQDESTVQQPKETLAYKLHGLVLANPYGMSKSQISIALYGDDSHKSMNNTERVIRVYREKIRESQGLNYYYNAVTGKYHVCKAAAEVEKIILQLMTMSRGLDRSVVSLLKDYNQMVPAEQQMTMEEFQKVIGG
jgi:hypothetical protein